jgi:hypothetical protein
MGHTVYPIRWIIYDKIDQMKKLVKGLREPEKRIAEELLDHVFQNISAINYANPLPLEIENNMIFSMLLQEKKKGDVLIDDLTLMLFSLMIMYKENQLKKPNESDIHRLLRPAG